VFGLIYAQKEFIESFGFTSQSDFVYLFVFYSVHNPVDFFASIGANYVKRRHEYQADNYAVTQMGKGADLKKALIALNVQGKKPVRLADLYVYIHYSHPPLIQRLAAIDKDLPTPLTPSTSPTPPKNKLIHASTEPNLGGQLDLTSEFESEEKDMTEVATD
jgi:Zn-dependent protease with chaperone function